MKQGKAYWNTIALLAPLEYISLFFSSHNALAGRPTEKLIMRLKKELLV